MACEQDKGDMVMSVRIIHCLPIALLLSATMVVEVLGQEEGRGFFPPQQAGAGGGPGYALVQLSLPDLDNRLLSMGLEGLPEWISLVGVNGHFQIGSLMIGAFSLSGSVDRSGSSGGISREASVELSYSGITVGYVKAVRNMKLTLGGSLGTGSLVTRLRRFPQTGRTWDGIWSYYETGFTDSVDSAALDISSVLTGNYYFFEPFVSIRYWFIPLVAVDLSAVYGLAAIKAGKLELNGGSIADAPKLNLSGMGVKVGIFFGF